MEAIVEPKRPSVEVDACHHVRQYASGGVYSSLYTPPLRICRANFERIPYSAGSVGVV